MAGPVRPIVCAGPATARRSQPRTGRAGLRRRCVDGGKDGKIDRPGTAAIGHKLTVTTPRPGRRLVSVLFPFGCDLWRGAGRLDDLGGTP
jgi:hypothetical protein